MVKHIVMFTFNPQLSKKQKETYGKEIKEIAEALARKISGVQQFQVQLVPIGTSTHDLLMEGVFDSTETLQRYQEDPTHQSAVQTWKEIMTNRVCFDYIF